MAGKYVLTLTMFFILHLNAFAQKPDGDIDSAAPDSFLVAFETSKGAFEAVIYRDWGPLAADRFYHLVRLEFFDELSIFRVVPNYVAQFGIHNKESVNRAWRRMNINDEPVKASNVKGTISFARGGPKTRSTQMFINLRDNSNLDAMPVGGVVGYPPIGKIVTGIEVIDTLNGEYGNEPSYFQDSISVQGREFLDRRFPGLDYIKTVRLIDFD